MQQKVDHAEKREAQTTKWTTTEWQARVDLAAAHRLAVMHGLHEGIFNHLTFSVPGKSDRYYQIPFGLHWSEVTASCFMEIGWDGQLLAGEGEIERSCYVRDKLGRLDELHDAGITFFILGADGTEFDPGVVRELIAYRRSEEQRLNSSHG